MARIPEDEVERLKREVSVQRLAEAHEAHGAGAREDDKPRRRQRSAVQAEVLQLSDFRRQPR